jgi:ElaB/YqjD/DUF883 family membrane-anchored ribosome-binding protein
MMNKTEMKSDYKSKMNDASKTARDTMNSASDSTSEMIDTVTELGKTFFNNLSGSKEKAMEVASTTLNSLDKTFRTRPGVFVGGAAVLGFVAGYFLGHGRSPASKIQAGVDKIKDQIEKNINKVSEHLQ